MFDLKLAAKCIFRVNALMSVPLEGTTYRLGYDRYTDKMIITYDSLYMPENQIELFRKLEGVILKCVQRHKETTLKRLDRIRTELDQIPRSK